ncbi:hypothetical protein Droror1_Dr00014722 [Drosera rotundifolia]
MPGTKSKLDFYQSKRPQSSKGTRTKSVCAVVVSVMWLMQTARHVTNDENKRQSTTWWTSINSGNRVCRELSQGLDINILQVDRRESLRRRIINKTFFAMISLLKQSMSMPFTVTTYVEATSTI